MNELVQIGGAGGKQEKAADPSLEATRRRFFELMGAPIALATGVLGTGACTRPPTEFVMPYVDPPEQVIPGRPEYYATASLLNGIAEGVIVESHLGRPTKVEGNAKHPGSLGATSVHAQACVLDLYDPFRAQQISKGLDPASWDAFLLEFAEALDPLRGSKGEGLRLLTETVISPTLGSQIEAVLARFPEAKWHQYDPAGGHSARAGSMAAFGKYVNTYYRLDQADVIVSLDADFLASGPAYTRYAHDYAFGRRVRGSDTKMNRLYVVESTFTSTGGKADHRMQMKYSEIGRFAVALAAALGVPGSAAATQSYGDLVAALSRDLNAHRGRSAILVGENQPAALHALAHAMNAALGNAGKTVVYTEPIEVRPEDQVASLKQLTSAMQDGAVKTLLIAGGNPVYNAPADFGFAGALEKVPMSIHLNLQPDETSHHTTWHVPESHFLETWGDARAYDGTVTILQPLIDPIYHSHSAAEVMDLFLRNPNRVSREIVQSYWRKNGGMADFDRWWRRALGDGLVENSALAPITPAVGTIDTSALLAQPAGGIELTFRTDPFIYDGRYASNSWLQELPRHMTKLTWDNAVHISPRTAKRLKLEQQHVVRIESEGRSVEGSVWLSPGQPDDSVTVHLGYGRSNAGVVGNGAGFDAYLIRTSNALWSASGVEMKATGKKYRLATAQMEMSEHGRELAISRPVAEYVKDPAFAQQMSQAPDYDETLYPHWEFPRYSWGMTVDLNACVNCSSCVIACQAENNIPVVGKEQQLFNREMHWLRVDVYYSGDWNKPSALYQPVPCMHCENAPCELVCPVNATVHSSDGLNEMVYNRCIGTRFCSNNCPYKVRRFNFLLYADWYTEALKMQRNPDVTVRSRGVIEKCTYCVQRIREAEIRAEKEHRPIRDGEVLTACQQVCPTQAIVFGNMNDSGSRVSKLKHEKRNYSLLAELNTRPHTTYLAELRNPNPEWPNA